jgi:(1->4)-alpha-D-glucan 1-alpha-D-glucosylmutase
VQLTPDFTLHDAAALVPYLADLGVSHVYCSPWLRPAPGSRHGYDVVDHGEVNPELGGAGGVKALRSACDTAGIGIVLDLVPNHMHVGAPEPLNAAWWDVLEHGERAGHANWFDVDWPLRIPVLGSAGDTTTPDPDDPSRVRYGKHTYPAEGGYELVPWREGPSYRRFFDIDTLAGLRVEDPAVFAATHALIARQVRDGIVAGLRIDHPDGLADPADYLDKLAGIAPDRWIVVEKVLEPGERLPGGWACDGTTGYEALTLLTGLMTDPAGEEPLTALAAELTGERPSWPAAVEAGKRLAANEILVPEVRRLAHLAARDLPGADPASLHDAIVELLVAMDVYRAYVRPGHPVGPAARDRLLSAAARATERRPELAAVLADLVTLLAGAGSTELVVRFQQTCGPVMAKGVEDTACYRDIRLVALNEVGGDPGRFGLPLDDWHAACQHAQRHRPHGMTTLSTHDTKRSEDVRARLLLLSEDPDGWAPLARHLVTAATDEGMDARTGYLLAQTLLGAWPISGDRLAAYLAKATKEAKLLTSWVNPDPDYDALVHRVGYAMAEHPAVMGAVEHWLEQRAEADLAASLAAKLVQLTMPGVPDCYQGCETVDRSLVDPDNRRPVDHPALRAALAAGRDTKLRLVATTLQLRRDHPGWFGAAGSYEPLGLDDDRYVGFVRAGCVRVVAPRRPFAVSEGAYGAELGPPDDGWIELLPDLPVSLQVRL